MSKNKVYFYTELDEEPPRNKPSWDDEAQWRPPYNDGRIREDEEPPKKKWPRSKKIVGIDFESISNEVTNLMDNFGDLMTKNSINSNYHIDEINLNVAVSAQGSILIAGGGVTGGVTIKLKQNP